MRAEAVELAVIGAGPAGMEAALAACEAGVKTAIIEALPAAGGQYFRRLPSSFVASETTEAEDEGKRLTSRLESSLISKHLGSLAWGLFRDETNNGWLVALVGPDAPNWLKARTLVLANGAYDRPAAFPGWTLPGVITCGAVLTLIKTQRIAPGRRAIVTGTGPLLLSAAAHLAEAGVEVPAVCESSRLISREASRFVGLLGQPSALREGWPYLWRLISKRVPYRMGWSVFEAIGDDHVKEAVIGRIDAEGYPIAGSERRFPADTVVCGYGLTPNIRLARMAGCRLVFRADAGGWVPLRDGSMRSSQPGVYVVGDAAGIRGAENARLEGRQAGVDVARLTGHLDAQQAETLSARIAPSLARTHRQGELLGKLFPVRPGWRALAGDDTALCRCEEVTLGDVKTAVLEGARSMETVKMVTRAGMGDCQGRMCERLVSEALLGAMDPYEPSRDTAELYSIRPPLHPVPLETLAAAGLEE